MINESIFESIVLSSLESLGWAVKHGEEIAPDELFAERKDYGQVVLEGRLKDALMRLNPDLPPETIEEALRRLTNPPGATLEQRNRSFHRMLLDGVTVEYRRPDGSIAGAQVRALDFDDPENNDWLAVNQFTVVENRHKRRPDIVLFVNGLPLAALELKNPTDEETTIWTAFRQLQMYKAEIPSLFVYNELLVISDGFKARLGTLTAGREWFKPWKTISGERVEGGLLPIEILLKGVFEISSKPPGSRNPTSPSFRTNSSTKSGECPRRTSPWNCCANSSMGRSKFVGGKASSSTAASQRCSRKPSGATTTGPSKRWKLSRNSLSSLEKSGGKPPWRSPRPLRGEFAFYETLEANGEAARVLGEPTLRRIAQELVCTLRENVTVDWTIRESARAYLRVLVKRTLRKYDYPRDKEEKAVQTVLEQAETLSEEWAGGTSKG